MIYLIAKANKSPDDRRAKIAFSMIMSISISATSCTTYPSGQHDQGTTMSSELDGNNPRNHHQLHIPNINWGQGKNVGTYQQFSISGIPKKGSLLYAKASGISMIIDLRRESEATRDEKRRAEAVGLPYINLESPHNNRFTEAFLQRLAQILKGSGNGKKILIHHETQDLAAAWVTAFIADRGNLNVETAVGIGSSFGLTNSQTLAKLRNFLDPMPTPKDPKLSKSSAPRSTDID